MKRFYLLSVISLFSAGISAQEITGGSGVFIYASNEPKSVLARDLGDCRDNLRNSQSVFLIVLHFRKVLEILPDPYIYVVLMSC